MSKINWIEKIWLRFNQLHCNAETIIVFKDNNYDGRGGRGANVKDPNEMLVLRLATPLTDGVDAIGLPLIATKKMARRLRVTGGPLLTQKLTLHRKVLLRAATESIRRLRHETR